MTTKHITSDTPSCLGVTTPHTISSYSAFAMKEYGIEVIEQRAIPDFRDGLKPVQRCLLWAAYKLGLQNNHGFKKSARLVGEVIGKYHPHGDASAYQALVGMTGTKFQGKKDGWATRNTSTPLIEGQGNWGDFIDAAAAYRYTEMKLSKFSDLMMLDPDYLAVMDFLPNFDDSEKIPVILPAKLPVVLLNGFVSIAVGVSGGSPPFGLKGVLQLTTKALRGEDITLRDCIKTLKFDPPYGGVCVSEPKELAAVFKGKGSVYFMPEYSLDEKARTLTFHNVCPGLMSAPSVEKFLNNLSLVKGVSSVDDDTSKDGAKYVVTFARTLSAAEMETSIDACLDISLRSDDYDVGITIRDTVGRASFRRISIPEIFKLWSEWRIGVEVKVLDRLIQLDEQAKSRQELYLLAVRNLSVIIKALQVKEATAIVKVDGVSKEVDASAAFLMRELKLSLTDALFILDMRVRQLRTLESSKILSKIQEYESALRLLRKDLKNPADRVIRGLGSIPVTEF